MSSTCKLDSCRQVFRAHTGAQLVPTRPAAQRRQRGERAAGRGAAPSLQLLREVREAMLAGLLHSQQLQRPHLFTWAVHPNRHGGRSAPSRQMAGCAQHASSPVCQLPCGATGALPGRLWSAMGRCIPAGCSCWCWQLPLSEPCGRQLNRPGALCGGRALNCMPETSWGRRGQVNSQAPSFFAGGRDSWLPVHSRVHTHTHGSKDGRAPAPLRRPARSSAGTCGAAPPRRARGGGRGRTPRRTRPAPA